MTSLATSRDGGLWRGSRSTTPGRGRQFHGSLLPLFAPLVAGASVTGMALLSLVPVTLVLGPVAAVAAAGTITLSQPGASAGPAASVPGVNPSSIAPATVGSSVAAPASSPTRTPYRPAADLGRVWPLTPVRVVDDFAPPSDRWGAGHRGVDLAGLLGAPVRSAEAGTVSFVGRIAGRPVLVVRRGAERDTYEPVNATVEVGDQVVAGETIGHLVAVGSHCAPAACLHWGLKRDAEYLDPRLGLSTDVRLLPLGRPRYTPGR